ncbi:hypothetical protein FHX74_002152 [Friedmanniella endophytica]|uniref:Uncharacterized protein n=1 Tax=Microlunatus kandeliicorticis TaxID=1759536 RepID=A0A7W3P634_9ACTN|nr:hypothetical protein [Microlunatus kandeliicorticis]MBA8794533.1 hypothetical protein [Microlunatus kandeliicorticis]
MQTLRTARGLLADVVRLLRARWGLLIGWYCLGWAVHQGCLFLSALLGVDHAVLANLVFVVGVVARLLSLVLMIQALEPALGFAALRPAREPVDGADPPTGLRIPASVFERHGPWQTAALAIGPFLAVYAVWGFVEDEVRDLFVANYTVLGLGDVTRWSISLDPARWRFYLATAVAGWLVRTLAEQLRRRRPGRPLDAVAVLAEGVWTFGVFVLVVIAAKAVRGWLQTRVVTLELLTAWQTLLDLVPDWRLPFGPTLSQLLDTLVRVAPGAVGTVLLLPLMWLALTATVFGWRDIRADEVVAGTRLEARVRRLTAAGSAPRDPLAWVARTATSDLRTKYLPVAQAFRLVLAAGPRLVGVYLVLATLLASVANLLAIGLTVLVGPTDQAVGLLLDPLEQLLVSLPVTVVSVTLYGAGFDRAVVVATRGPGEDGDPTTTPAPAPAAPGPAPAVSHP